MIGTSDDDDRRLEVAARQTEYITRAGNSAGFMTVEATVKCIREMTKASVHAGSDPSETIEWE